MVLFLLFVLPSFSSATRIMGSIYDSDLTKLENVVVDISTSPRQVHVSRTGEYQFNVSNGDYTIRARQKNNDLFAIETVSVKDEGDYALDLILLPNINEEVFLINETAQQQEIPKFYWLYYAISILLAVLSIASIYFYKKARKLKETKKQEPETKPVQIIDEDSRKILELLKKQGGRLTQKEIRKSFPASEAKISLIITDLESRKLVKRIKKGRGNIVVLVERN